VKKTLLIAALFALSGCQTRFVTRSCISPEQFKELKAQEPPKVADKLTGRADEDIRPIAGSAIRLRGWAHNLLDVVELCAS
jgi:hypothetical protein